MEISEETLRVIVSILDKICTADRLFNCVSITPEQINLLVDFKVEAHNILDKEGK